MDPTLGRLRAGIAVLAGIILSLSFGNPYADFMKKLTAKILAWSIVGLGFGMNLLTILHVGLQGIAYTILSILGVIVLGLALGRWLKNSDESSLLITVGTAICGGSAIAAIAPTIHAKHENISLALAVVFVLNASALFVFPAVGHFLHLTQHQFGLWSALAIQDTSSVVGATLQYGHESLMVGTTVKLARALWIVPMTLFIAFWTARKTHHEIEKVKAKKPWFIVGFIGAAALVTWVPSLQVVGQTIHTIAEQALVIALFCIGASLSRTSLYALGVRPLLQGLILWSCLASSTLYTILSGWIT
jgi:uncharacterized integral membrane protein (TIGR00698 family)